MRIQTIVSALALAAGAVAKTVTYDFNVTWVTANPDGSTERKIIGINNQWPLPVIEVDRGDQLVVNMFNGLGDRNTSIHWHGMFQNGTGYMDGPSMVTQCPVPPGMSLTYNFTVNQNGTYWYHCHTDFCYPDGYRQALIVHDKDQPFVEDVEEEFTITLSDWYHEFVEDIRFISLYNPTGAEPIPDAFLVNDTQNLNISVKPDTTYMFRIINIGAFVSQYFYIEGHNMTIIEMDGVYTEPLETDVIFLGIGQRYSVLFHTKNETSVNYPFVTVVDSTLLDTIPPELPLNMTNWLQYDANADHPQATITIDDSTELNPIDDMLLVPFDHMPLLPEADFQVEVSLIMDNLITGAGYAFFDNITYTPPKVPTLFSVLSTGGNASDAQVYGDYTHSYVMKHNDVIEVVVNNADSGAHPLHLHGHNFQVIDRQPRYGPDFYSLDGDVFLTYDPNNHTAFPEFPARRDVFMIPPQGYFVIRYVADNPGVWFFHCHIDWHLSQGLAMTFIEAPEQAQSMVIPDDHLAVCKAAGVPFQGNAAGNSVNVLDLSGQNAQPKPLPAGFTGRGIVALVFSVISAVLGIAAITVYGLSDIKFKTNWAAETALRMADKAENEGASSAESQ